MKRTILIVLALALCTVVGAVKADFTFGTPTNLGPTVNSPARDLKPSVSADGLSLFFTSTRSGGVGGMDIWVTTRETTEDPWGEPVNLGSPVNSSAWETGYISYDGLSFYFSSTRSRGGNANADIWVTTRDTIHNEWGTPMNLGPTVNSPADQCYVSISADELELYFSSNRSGGHGAYDLWVTTRETIHDPWGTPVNLGPTVNSSSYDVDTSISSDGRMLFFASDRPGGYGGATDDIWLTTRETTDDRWGEPVNLGPTINSSAWEDCPNVSADGSTLFFRYSQSGRHGGGDIWQAPIIPVVDFNGDGQVDGVEVCTMADRWGTDDPLCDVGPLPWGDGIVDVQDLIVLAESIGEKVEDLTLAAHWALDEAEGMIASDRAGNHDGTVMGVSLWHPEGGCVDGALEFSGTTFVVADSAVDPGAGPFSVLAWVHGGAPGQAIISQQAGCDWLMLDPATGALMTELRSGGRQSKALISDAIISDGDWHRIGFAWDGSNRRLYVDDILVAEDTDVALGACNGGLNIGCGKLMTWGTFFTGLIDDVRIYNRAVKP
jgi:hypothetical protein